MTAKAKAAALGMARTTYLHRVKHGLPLDAPVLNPSERVAKANEVRLKNQAMAKLVKEREKRMAWQARENARREAKEARLMKRKREAEQRAQRRLDAMLKRLDEIASRPEESEVEVIKAAPRKQWSNPFALLAGKRSVTTASPTAPTTSAKSLSTASSGTSVGGSIPARTYARGGI